MCHPCISDNLRTLRLPDHRSWHGSGWCLLLLCSLCQPAWNPRTGRSGRRTCDSEERGMKVSEIMTRDVAIIQPDDTLYMAAQKMRDRDIGFLPVCDGTSL